MSRKKDVNHKHLMKDRGRGVFGRRWGRQEKKEEMKIENGGGVGRGAF